MDVFKAPKEYGFADFADATKNLTNPDNQYDDNPFVRQNPQHKSTTVISDKRLDGQLTGSPKPHGTRDILAYMETYYHKNGYPFQKSERVGNPIGFYLVLWDDGKIQQIDYDEVRFAIADKLMYTVFFGQTGVPPTTITYQELWMDYLHLGKLPIGYPLPNEQAEPMADNGAIESLVALSRWLNKETLRSSVWEAFAREIKEFRSEEVVGAAAKLDLPLVSQRLSLADLEKTGSPRCFVSARRSALCCFNRLGR